MPTAQEVRCPGRPAPSRSAGCRAIKDLRKAFFDEERVAASEIEDRDGIVGSIKDFLGKGR
ncbi:MAG: hypothetical protein JXB32_00715 [Deltaproteobacteria bacterium]|nr:hypothetical protein [Deltaproteobacteria bacterium]